MNDPRPAVRAAMELTRRLYAEGLRPLPLTNSVPLWVARAIHTTCGAYEGEPRADMFLDEACAQAWFAQWVDVVVSLWAGPIDLDGRARFLQRNQTMLAIGGNAPAQDLVVLGYRREGLKGAREVLMRWTSGPPPMLIEEFEAGIHRLGQVH